MKCAICRDTGPVIAPHQLYTERTLKINYGPNKLYHSYAIHKDHKLTPEQWERLDKVEADKALVKARLIKAPTRNRPRTPFRLGPKGAWEITGAVKP